jgi:hypothetical protein
MRYDVTARALALATLLATAALAGCGGSQSLNPSSQLSPQLQTQNNAPALGGANPLAGSCQSGPLQVNPCVVDFTRHGPKVVMLSVQAPPNNQITERNNCRDRRRKFDHKREIAKVHGGGSNWWVSAGPKRGYCEAVFTMSGHGPSQSVTVAIRNARGEKKHRF